MAMLAFGLAPAIDPSAVLLSCAGFPFVEHVYIEKTVSRPRKTRWLLLFGAESSECEPLLVALLRTAKPLQLVVDTGYNWRAGELSIEVDKVSATFSALDQFVHKEDPEATLRGMVEQHLSKADADVLARSGEWSDPKRWLHWRRDSAAPHAFIETTEAHGEDACGWALDCVEVYDTSWDDEWDEGDPSLNAAVEADYNADHRAAQSGDYAAALSAVDRALASQFVRSDHVRYGTKQFNRACYLSRLGRIEESLDALEISVNNMRSYAADARTDDDLANARLHPRFESAIKIPY